MVATRGEDDDTLLSRQSRCPSVDFVLVFVNVNAGRVRCLEYLSKVFTEKYGKNIKSSPNLTYTKLSARDAIMIP